MQSVEHRIMESGSRAGKCDDVAIGKAVKINGSGCEFEYWLCH